MKENRLITYLFLGIISALSAGRINAQQQIFFADVSIYTENGKYYLSGTRPGQPLGFKLLESDNLTDWHFSPINPTGIILGPAADVYGTSKFWAPQILKDNNMYYITYSADSHIAVAKSSTLNGPYSNAVVEPIDASAGNIDSDIFKDDDGKYYMYHVRFNKGNFIWVAGFNITTGKMDMSTLKQCFSTSQPWETQSIGNPVMEGPSVIKYKGIYYMFYSANYYTDAEYAVGYATATSPYGPWTKFTDNPIISSSTVMENGSGHGDFFIANDGKPYYVYHVHFSNTTTLPRRTRIVPLHFTPNIITGIYSISIDANEVIIPEITSTITAIKRLPSNSTIRLFPNPATNRITVVKNDAGAKLESIYNIIGCQVLKLNNSDNQIDISAFNSGVYFLRSNSSGKFEITVFVKQ